MSGLASLPTVKDSLRGKIVKPSAIWKDAKEVMSPTIPKPEVVPYKAPAAIETPARADTMPRPRTPGYATLGYSMTGDDEIESARKRLLGA
jgi:hypothetical protein